MSAYQVKNTDQVKKLVSENKSRVHPAFQQIGTCSHDLIRLAGAR